MDARYLTPFLISTRRVIETMVHTTVDIRTPEVRSDTCALADVSAVIGLSSDVTGCVVLSMDTAAACRIASSFAGQTLDTSSPDFSDAVGELANMIAGNAKSEMHGLHVSISLPSVVIGRRHAICQMRTLSRVVIPCETGLGPFFVDVGIRAQGAGSLRTASAGASL